MVSALNYMQDMKSSFKSLKWYEWIMIAVMTVIAGMSMAESFADPAGGYNPPWLAVINFVSGICGIMCIFFTAKASRSNFIFAVINTAVYIVFLWYHRIYGTMCLEIFVYFPMNFISWGIWYRHKDEKERQLTKAKKLTAFQNTAAALLVAGGTVIYHQILEAVGGTAAWLDAATLAIGLIAVFLEAFRYREQYVWWIITDIVAVAMYIVHFDPVYLTKKSIYLIMAVIGLINWVRLNRERNAANA